MGFLGEPRAGPCCHVPIDDGDEEHCHNDDYDDGDDDDDSQE